MTAALQIVMTRTEATAITTRIRLLVETIASNTEKVVTLIEQAEAGEAWRAMEYPSWTAYVAGEFSGALKSLEKAERIPVVAKLAETGMSTRAIGSIVGASKDTVSRDLRAGVSGDTPAKSIVGTDGKNYTRPATFLPSGRPDARSTSDMGRSVPAPKKRPRPDARTAYQKRKDFEALLADREVISSYHLLGVMLDVIADELAGDEDARNLRPVDVATGVMQAAAHLLERVYGHMEGFYHLTRGERADETLRHDAARLQRLVRRLSGEDDD